MGRGRRRRGPAGGSGGGRGGAQGGQPRSLFAGMGQVLGGSEGPEGLERAREGGDGDCLFHAIARQALGDSGLAGRAREEICDWMELHLPPSAAAGGRSALTEAHRAMVWEQRAEVLSCGAGGDAPALAYVRQMRRRGEWGSGLEALCAAYCYGRPVHVWSPGGFSELRPPPALLQPGTEPLRLLHNGHNHWDSLLPPPGSSGPAPPADAADEDTALALALSESLDQGDEAPTISFPLIHNDDERSARRAMAAAAAERREQALAERGLGPRARMVMQTQQQDRVVKPTAASASSAQGEVIADAKPDSDSAVCRPGASSSSATGSAPSGAAPPAAAAEPASGSGTGGRWARRRAARAAAGEAQDTSDASPSGTVLLVDTVSQEAVPGAASTGAGDLEECMVALCRVGFTRAEAMEALARSNGDVDRVKELYCIDWDSSGRTLQLPFATQS